MSDKKIISSWEKNVAPWIRAIDENEIESRASTTNKAILTQIKNRKPTSVLDIGCGEGWLVNTLASDGINALGIDAIPEFITYAQQEHSGRYKLLLYENLDKEPLHEKFDIIVCNFSLLGKESVEAVFKQIPVLLKESGGFIIQTIHPYFGNDGDTYKDEWRNGSWKGFNNNFSDPAPWYFRTLGSWIKLFSNNGLIIKRIYEPYFKKNAQIASIIFYAELTR